MTLTILIVILSVFAILGITEFIHNLAFRMFSVDGSNNTASLIVLKEETAIDQMKLALFEYKWYGTSRVGKIIAVYDNLSFETLEIIKDFAREKDIILVPTEYVKNVINAVF